MFKASFTQRRTAKSRSRKTLRGTATKRRKSVTTTASPSAFQKSTVSAKKTTKADNVGTPATRSPLCVPDPPTTVIQHSAPRVATKPRVAVTKPCVAATKPRVDTKHDPPRSARKRKRNPVCAAVNCKRFAATPTAVKSPVPAANSLPKSTARCKKRTTQAVKRERTQQANALLHVFDDSVSNSELRDIIDAHVLKLKATDADHERLTAAIVALEEKTASLNGFHSIHECRSNLDRIQALKRELVDVELNSRARRFKEAADVLFDKIAVLQSSGTDIAVMEGLSVQEDTANPDTAPSGEPGNPVAAAVPRRRQVALSAMRTISFAEPVATAPAPDEDGTGSAQSLAAMAPTQFRELLMDDLRVLICPTYRRPAYRASEEECSQCKGTLSFMSGLNVLVCDNPACQQEQQASSAHVGSGNRDFMTLSNCRYKKRNQFSKKIARSAKKLVLKNVMPVSTFYDIRKFVTEAQKRKQTATAGVQQEGSELQDGVPVSLVAEAVFQLGYQKQLGTRVEFVTALVNFVPPPDYTPAQVTCLLELFMLGEPAFDEMQRNNEVHGRINTLSHNLRGKLLNSMMTFGDKHKTRFKELKGKVGAAQQQDYFQIMMEREGIRFTKIEL